MLTPRAAASDRKHGIEWCYDAARFSTRDAQHINVCVQWEGLVNARDLFVYIDSIPNESTMDDEVVIETVQENYNYRAVCAASGVNHYAPLAL